MIKVRTQAFKNKLKGHKDGIIALYSQDLKSGTLYSASKDGGIRLWNLTEKKIDHKLFVTRNNKQQEENNSQSFQEDQQYENQDQEEEEEEDEEEEEEQKNNSQQVQNAQYFLQQQEQEEEQQFLCAVFTKNSVIAGYDDGSIYQWNLQSGEIRGIYQGHIGRINDVKMINDRQLVSISSDFTVRIWDIMSGSNEFIYKLTGEVTHLRTEGHIIHVIVSKNTYFKIDNNKHKVIQRIQFANTIITCFIIHKTQLIFGTIESKIEVYDLSQCIPPDEENENNIEPIKVIEGLDGWILSMNILNNYLFTGGDDRLIKVWNLDKNLQKDEELKGHKDGIISIDFAEEMLYTGSYDHSICSWNLQEMYNRIRERRFMMREDLWSKKHDAYYNKLHSKKKKKKGKGKKKK